MRRIVFLLVQVFRGVLVSITDGAAVDADAAVVCCHFRN